MFRAGRCAVVRTWQGQTWNPGLRPPKGPRKVSLPSPLSLTAHWQLTVSSIRPCRHPHQTGWLDMSLPRPRNPALCLSRHLFIIPVYHSSARQGHIRWAPVRSDVTGTDLGCGTVAWQHHGAWSFLTLGTKAARRWEEGALGREREHRKLIITYNSSHSRICFISYQLQSTATQLEDTGWIWATSSKIQL